MSMSMVTMFQFLGTLAAYLFVTLAIPCAVFSRKVSHYRFTKRVIFYFITGNFYATNLVFVLQLLYLANFFTIWFGLIGVPAIAWGVMYKYPLKDKLSSFVKDFRKVLSGSLGVRSVVSRVTDKIRMRLSRAVKSASKNYFRNWIDWWLVAALILMVFWVYGVRMLSSYGYSASDIPVHLYWTNGLSDNNLFAGGIYPLGMHCIIYLLNTAFRIDTYVIFRVFALIQCLAIHVMGLMFLKLCCKSKFAAYPGIFLYAIGDFVRSNNLLRYLSTLPQEYSMIYILPTAYFAISFFKQLRREIKDGLPNKDSMLSLCGLTMSFCLAFTGHFYGAMIAGIFCLGIAVGHIGWILRPVYLKRIAIAGLLSLLIALLPMVIAFAVGTPLEGSLYWGSNIIKNSQTNQTQTDTDTSFSGDTTIDSVGESSGEVVVAPKISISERIKQFATRFWQSSIYRIGGYILLNSPEWFGTAAMLAYGFLIASGVLLMFFRSSRSYGAMLLSAGAFMVFLSLMFTAKEIDLPVLMGADRVCIFYAYVLVIVIGLTIDVCIYFATCMFKRKWPMHLLSLAVVIVVAIGVWKMDRVRPSLRSDGLETNEAVTCLTNIIASEPDFKWTIFSANDETNMVFGHGYHYELSTFLHEIEELGDKPVTATTESVYFYIEKIPLNYAITYEGSGQMISQKGAEEPLPNAAGLGNYQAKNRWIIMSHMYYWAQEFQRLYPKEMTVYYETDQFICYKLVQNTYRQYDLAIDYGYNSVLKEG